MRQPVIEFDAAGEPRPKGSQFRAIETKAGWRAMPIQPSALAKKNKAWSSAILEAASKVAPSSPLDEPLFVALKFRLSPPKKPRFNSPASKPDLDKLARFVLDVLEGVIYTNDSRVVELFLSKEYSVNPGVSVVCRTIKGDE